MAQTHQHETMSEQNKRNKPCFLQPGIFINAPYSVTVATCEETNTTSKGKPFTKHPFSNHRLEYAQKAYTVLQLSFSFSLQGKLGTALLNNSGVGVVSQPLLRYSGNHLVRICMKIYMYVHKHTNTHTERCIYVLQNRQLPKLPLN